VPPEGAAASLVATGTTLSTTTRATTATTGTTTGTTTGSIMHVESPFLV
jgi:hypothetical protein